jgi:hypothetical protein
MMAVIQQLSFCEMEGNQKTFVNQREFPENLVPQCKSPSEFDKETGNYLAESGEDKCI